MDGRDSAECQNWEKKDIIGINGIVLSELKDKILNSGCLLQKGGQKGNVRRKKRGNEMQWLFLGFLE